MLVFLRKARLLYTCKATLAFRKKSLASLRPAQLEDFVFKLKPASGGLFCQRRERVYLTDEIIAGLGSLPA